MAILNMVGGGSGGLKSTDAILRVIAPAGSTVTISKGTVSKSDQGHENASDTSLYDYYFIIHASQFDSVNPWTVTGTLGSDTAIKTIIIDSADEYDVLMEYLVPITYQPVEYLESTGTQYITTGVSPSANFVMDIDLQGSQTSLFGSNLSGGGTNAYRWSFNYNSHYSSYVGPNGTEQNFTTASAGNRVQLQFEQTSSNKQYFTLTYGGTTETKSYTQTTATGRVLWLFAYRGGSWAYGKVKIYRATMYNNGSMVGDYIPCYRKSDSVAGMWDRVGETFYTNEGTGTFIVGGDR